MRKQQLFRDAEVGVITDAVLSVDPDLKFKAEQRGKNVMVMSDRPVSIPDVESRIEQVKSDRKRRHENQQEAEKIIRDTGMTFQEILANVLKRLEALERG